MLSEQDAGDDLPPPLEDMSHLLPNRRIQARPTPVHVPSTSTVTVPAAPVKEFSGFKKGFLTAPKVKKPKKKDDEIPFIKHSAPKANNLSLPQVQTAMQDTLKGCVV
jgi:hypothetical protein